jgi:hypothetical protein
MSHAGPKSALLDSREIGRSFAGDTEVRTASYLLLLALAAAAAHGAEVYRSKNADGSVTYSDRPTNDNSEFVPTVQGTRPAGTQGGQRTAAARPNAPPAAGRTAPGAAPEAPAAPAPLSGPSSAELREKRQKNCEVAKEREQRYELSRRLYKTNDKGEREYLDDKSVAEAKAKAAQDVKDWCD